MGPDVLERRQSRPEYKEESHPCEGLPRLKSWVHSTRKFDPKGTQSDQRDGRKYGGDHVMRTRYPVSQEVTDGYYPDKRQGECEAFPSQAQTIEPFRVAARVEIKEPRQSHNRRNKSPIVFRSWTSAEKVRAVKTQPREGWRCSVNTRVRR